MENGLRSAEQSSQARRTAGGGRLGAGLGGLATLRNPPSRPALFYKRSRSAGGSPLRGLIACMPLLPARVRLFTERGNWGRGA